MLSSLAMTAVRGACRVVSWRARQTRGRRATRSLVLDNVRVIDGTGAQPIERGRIVIAGGRIVRIGPAATVQVPADAETLDLSGQTVIPGLIDLHFHIEDDPKLALRQLSHGVTSFRDPGQWDEKFEGLRQMIAADQLPGPRIFTTGPHIDGERPAYPADAVVARDAEEARRLAERAVAAGGVGAEDLFPAALRERESGDRRLRRREAFRARRISRCSTRASSSRPGCTGSSTSRRSA